MEVCVSLVAWLVYLLELSSETEPRVLYPKACDGTDAQRSSRSTLKPPRRLLRSWHICA